ncbi:unnamed protein product [Rhizoctonia solani]|uniref:Major facilitator superfamily (MFS) profile domain-containing protein n=3 Tax=Rhizoctonia solani TaxID=456999 RepID=A0A8H2WIV0_9AGAM|nr:MFS sugar transporter [Rhizoctonia solani AG-3 Rhs1AP]KEP53824.1 MFS sugar transporter [Rhizoctonia solani 123E]CAE6377947.1 unnamed protein product [Rhizoctonia solani]CAE6413184.1 unnamed protein product [Rhizoctonia solani]
MRGQSATDARDNELDFDKEQVEDSAGILEALSSLPITRSTTATGVEVHAREGALNRNHTAPETSSDSPVVSYNIPPAQTPTKQISIYFVSAYCSLGGFLFGADTGSIGSITSMPQFIEVYPTLKNEAVLGALVATILMSASLASFASGWLSDKYSRKWTIMLGAYIFGLGAALEAGSLNLAMLIVGRLIVGVGEGFFLSAIGVYLVEIAPPDVRGRISCMLQLFVTIGIAAGYFICYGSLNIQSTLSWRTPFIVQVGVAIILGSGMPWLPYSPRWLFQNGRVEEAWRVLEAFDRHSSSEKEKEELIAKAQERQGQDDTFGVVEAFKDPDSRGRTLLAVFMMGMQQLSGIDGVLFYGPILFSQAGLTSRQASFLASGVSGILNIVCTIPAQFYLLDKWGRRPSAIVGGLVMAVCMLTIGSMYAAGADAGQGRYAIIVFIYLFVIAFSTTWAVSFKLFVTEIQPTRARATTSSLAHSSNWLCNLAVALTTPLFLSRSSSGPYFMFGACLLLTSVVCMIWMPETLGKSLQEVDEVWDIRMKKSKEIIHSLVTFGVGRERRNNTNEIELQEQGRV